MPKYVGVDTDHELCFMFLFDVQVTVHPGRFL